MKAALIPPKNYYATMHRTDYQLVLAQIIEVDYIKECNAVDDKAFMILDNGAAEGSMVSVNELFFAASLYGPDEIVAPDVLGDKNGTIKLVKEFMGRLDKPKLRYMLVVQGLTLREVYDCIKEYADSYPMCDFTFGLPRHLLTTLDNRFIRGNLVSWIKGEYPNDDPTIHMLGTNPVYPSEVEYLAKHWGEHIRGIDTSLPYNFTMAGKRLDQWHMLDFTIKRPRDYFTEDWHLDRKLLRHNIDTYLGWASGA